MKTLGFRVLQNDRVEIAGANGFDLAGVPDWMGPRYGEKHTPRLRDTLAGRAPAREVVLLAHQPKQFDEAATLDVGLQLSGHTHGGQIWPFTWLIHIAERRVAGLFHEGRSQLYVSRGTGFWVRHAARFALGIDRHHAESCQLDAYGHTAARVFRPVPQCDREHRFSNDGPAAIAPLEALFARLENDPELAELRDASEFKRGKMIGVLVAQSADGTRHTLQAYSGDLAAGIAHRNGRRPCCGDRTPPSWNQKRCCESRT